MLIKTRFSTAETGFLSFHGFHQKPRRSGMLYCEIRCVVLLLRYKVI